jgi:hypothetical protein
MDRVEIKVSESLKSHRVVRVRIPFHEDRSFRTSVQRIEKTSCFLWGFQVPDYVEDSLCPNESGNARSQIPYF